jgi:hypothetical protein
MDLHLKKVEEQGKKTNGLFATRRALMGWTVLGVVVVSCASFFLIVSPQWSRVGAGKELDVAGLESTYTERERALNQIKSLRDNYDKIEQAEIALLSNILPTQKNIPELLQQLEAIARQSGVSLIDINISEVTEKAITARQALQQEVGSAAAAQKGKEIKQLNIQLQVTTSQYPAFKQLLEQLQSHTRLLDVESYLMSTEDETQSITLKAYYIEL